MSLGSSSVGPPSVVCEPPLAWLAPAADCCAAEPARGAPGRLAPHLRHIARDAQLPGHAQSVQ
eukprot:2958221-Lingulodinium_polyedra.AAC.1